MMLTMMVMAVPMDDVDADKMNLNDDAMHDDDDLSRRPRIVAKLNPIQSLVNIHVYYEQNNVQPIYQVNYVLIYYYC